MSSLQGSPPIMASEASSERLFPAPRTHVSFRVQLSRGFSPFSQMESLLAG